MFRVAPSAVVAGDRGVAEKESRASVTFLLNMMQPCNDTLMAVFREEQPAMPGPAFTPTSSTNASLNYMDFISDFFSPNDDYFGTEETFAMDLPIFDLERSSSALDHILANIKQGLRDTLDQCSSAPISVAPSPSTLSTSHDDFGPIDEGTTDMLLQGTHARILIATYFRDAIPDFPPVTHEPSFYAGLENDAGSSSPACAELVLAIMISASLHCAPHDYVLAARKLIKLSNEWIFARLQAVMQEFICQQQDDDDGVTSRQQQNRRIPKTVLDVVAAALTANGALSKVSDASEEGARYLRSGIPVQRLQQISSALRACGLDRARRSRPLFSSTDGGELTDWHTFVYEETCIRIANWGAMNDWLQSGCHNAQPPTGVAELRAALPSPLELWQAQSEGEFRGLLAAAAAQHAERRAVLTRSGTLHSRVPGSIAQLVEMLTSEDRLWRLVAGSVWATVNRTDLILTIIGIHAIILTARHSSMLPQVAPSLRLAISRWRKLWDSIDTPPSPHAVAQDTTGSAMSLIRADLRDYTCHPTADLNGISLPVHAPWSGGGQQQQQQQQDHDPQPHQKHQEQLRGLHRHAVGLAWLAACLLDTRVWHDTRFTELGYFRNVGSARAGELHELMEACGEL
ncbi:uncharacterized protein B0I36DRAFT_366494 [Microdochium trichocladiopsis]|uniref:Transcription factor domain-containing protein n=1 Tax=Microdochium trichocladiopsis TaxID=1682393 RepID=A0A9P8XYS1_9PEZI|nr:uncharacterized protein B0I36DRAFT_366494 [Microdochium trichocladiopsis]KAH7024555.1 hypothetical protein B0I36DRAFT_366494 [Microdochium trichocladiopsis]